MIQIDETDKSKENPVLVSKMFCGSYLETGVNIGHEIINFFSVSGSGIGIDGAVDPWAYFYIPNNGRVAKEFQEAGTRLLLVGRGKNNPIVYAQAEVCEYLGGGPAA